MKIKPLTEQETDMLLVLLRKIWKYDGANETVKRIAKNLFQQIINNFDDR